MIYLLPQNQPLPILGHSFQPGGLASPAMMASSSGLSSKRSRRAARFSLICAGVEAPGMTATPRARAHRSRRAAGLTP